VLLFFAYLSFLHEEKKVSSSLLTFFKESKTLHFYISFLHEEKKVNCSLRSKEQFLTESKVRKPPVPFREGNLHAALQTHEGFFIRCFYKNIFFASFLF